MSPRLYLKIAMIYGVGGAITVWSNYLIWQNTIKEVKETAKVVHEGTGGGYTRWSLGKGGHTRSSLGKGGIQETSKVLREIRKVVKECKELRGVVSVPLREIKGRLLDKTRN